MPVRPTLRCLREDLRLPVPTAAIPLDETDHPVLRKAAEQFASRDTPHERIASIDDVVLFKVKTGRWAGSRSESRMVSPVAGDPRQRPLHDPPAGQHLEGGQVIGTPDDLESELQGGLGPGVALLDAGSGYCLAGQRSRGCRTST